MAASVCILVGEKEKFNLFLKMLTDKAKKLQAGQQVGQIGPLIDDVAQKRVLKYVNEAETTNKAQVLVDGRGWARAEGLGEGIDPKGYWMGPTILYHNSASDPAVTDEIFGPVLSVLHVRGHKLWSGGGCGGRKKSLEIECSTICSS